MNRIEISPILSIAGFELLTPRGKLIMQTRGNIFDTEGTIFLVEGEGFYFRLSIDGDGIYAERNGESCILPSNLLPGNRVNFFVLTWSYDQIRLITGVDTPIEMVKETWPCAVPNSLKKWAREKSLLPQKEYDSEEDLRDAVYGCIASMKEKIERDGNSDAFWDIIYEGNAIISKNPKKEPTIHPHLKSLLDTELFLKGIDIYRENKTSVGNIDFTLTGYVKNKGLSSVCIEIKNAHSKEVEDGFTTQLPNYMVAQGAQYGAYCVLNYSYPTGNRETRAELVGRLMVLQVTSKNPYVRSNIRVYVIDLDKNVLASKK